MGELGAANYANLGKELAETPFEQLIGGVFGAVVNAQHQASMTTIRFLRTACFTPNDTAGLGEPRYFEMKYEKPGAVGTPPSRYKMRIPVMVFVPVPAIRVDEVVAEFNVKLTQHVTQDIAFAGSSTQIGSTSAKRERTDSGGSADKNNENSWSKTSSMFGMVTDKASNREGVAINREFTMRVRLEVKQDAIPAGMESILDILAGVLDAQSQGHSGGDATNLLSAQSSIMSRLQGGPQAAAAPAASGV
mmetsp:Transcript_23181/g.58008  ORF Transcript_23181/g.58008 Transcript_23181/m.58008 type:complete len:248 (+) Transcript_23181:235-978(+)|eukprot:CAMPEP_0177646984 /NCGR_PEP_ID=MMETSP0447-20121125/10060_1 /TAXON_ID=0 /ORGANISM="Stygamoeba regulata, Strain BSH-02190019" /LENGTH=247 /DNA_ID=CAMNT_0019149543 /DNA_START=218 /DNA_END=961 /DNA_ORIENTATION=+